MGREDLIEKVGEKDPYVFEDEFDVIKREQLAVNTKWLKFALMS